MLKRSRLSSSLQQEASEQLCRVIIEYSRKRTHRIRSQINTIQGKVHHELKVIPSLVVELPHAALEELLRLRDVKCIWNDEKVRVM